MKAAACVRSSLSAMFKPLGADDIMGLILGDQPVRRTQVRGNL
jgi:hypothetical protein